MSVKTKADFITQIKNKPVADSREYDFRPQRPGGTLAIGNNTIPLSPVPPGVNAANARHFLYISMGTGTAEACLIIGGTAVSGASSGTVIVACANTHSGAWTIESASSGVREAAYGIDMAGEILLKRGTTNLRAPLVLPTTISLTGHGSGVNAGAYGSRIECAAAADPAILVADDLGTATGQGIGRHRGYFLHGAASSIGLLIGGDPDAVLTPSAWTGSYTRYDDVNVQNFAYALCIQGGNFISFHRSVFNGLTHALFIPPASVGSQPIAFFDCVLTVPSGAAVRMDNSSFDTASLLFSGGQVSGTITGASVDWQSFGTHYEPNSVDTPILTIDTSTSAQQFKAIGGIMSTHGPGTPYHLGAIGSGYYNITVRDVYAQCDVATTVPAFVSYATSLGGALTIDNVFLAFAGTFTRLFTWAPSGGATPGLKIQQPEFGYGKNTPAAAAVVFPEMNFPVAGTVAVTGVTFGGGITAVSGLITGQVGTLFTWEAQTFTAGATIGNTITTTAWLPYTYWFDGTKIWIR